MDTMKERRVQEWSDALHDRTRIVDTISSRSRTRGSSIPSSSRRSRRVIPIAGGVVPPNLFVVVILSVAMSSVDQGSEWDEAGDEEEHRDEQFCQGGERVPKVLVVSSALFGGRTVEAVVDGYGVVEGSEKEEGGDDEEDGVVSHGSDGWRSSSVVTSVVGIAVKSVVGIVMSQFSLEEHQQDGQDEDGERDSEEDVSACAEQTPSNPRVPSVVSNRKDDTDGTEYDCERKEHVDDMGAIEEVSCAFACLNDSGKPVSVAKEVVGGEEETEEADAEEDCVCDGDGAIMGV